MVLTFQKPILVLVLALKTSILLSVASIRFSPLPVTRVSCDDSGSLSHLEVFFSFVAVSVTRLFLQNRVVSPVSNQSFASPRLCWSRAPYSVLLRCNPPKGGLPHPLTGGRAPVCRIAPGRGSSWEKRKLPRAKQTPRLKFTK